MESQGKSEDTGSVTLHRTLRSRANSSASVSTLPNDLPTTSGRGRITKGKSQETEKHVSTPMPRKTKRPQTTLKNVNVSLTKLKVKLNTVEHSAEENVVLEEDEILDQENLQSIEMNDVKINVESAIPNVDESNGSQLDSKKINSSAATASNEETMDLDSKHSRNLLAPINLKSESDVELMKSVPVQDISVTRATKWRQTIGGTIELSSENEVDDANQMLHTATESDGNPQMTLTLEKSSSTATDLKNFSTVHLSSDAQLYSQSGSSSHNQNDVSIEPSTRSAIIDSIEKKSNGTDTTSDVELLTHSEDAIHRKSDEKVIEDFGTASIVGEDSSPQSTKSSITQNELNEQSAEDSEESSLIFLDNEAEKTDQEDSIVESEMEVSEYVGDTSLVSDTSEPVENSEMSFNVSETSANLLATTKNDSDIFENTERKTYLKRGCRIEDTSEEDELKKLENVETKCKRLSDVMPVSEEVEKRMSLHSNAKVTSGELETSDALEGDFNLLPTEVSSDEKMDHENETEKESKVLNLSYRNRIYDTSDADEDVFKDMEKIPQTKSSKRLSYEMPVSKEMNKRMSLHPNVKLSSGIMKRSDVSDDLQNSKARNVENSTKHHSKQHNEIDDVSDNGISKQLENMSPNPKKIKTSRGLSETMSNSKSDFKQMSLHTSTLIKSAAGSRVKDSLATSLIADYDLKASQKGESTFAHYGSKAATNNSTDKSEAMDQLMNTTATSNKHTSKDSKGEKSQQLKEKATGKLKAKKK